MIFIKLYIVYFFTKVLPIFGQTIEFESIKDYQSEPQSHMSLNETTKNIYPGFQTQKIIFSESQWKINYPTLKRFQSLQDEQFSLTDSLKILKQIYKEGSYNLAIQIGQKTLKEHEDIQITDRIIKNAMNITYDLSIIRSILANSYINIYKKQRNKRNIKKALGHLKYQYDECETIYKKGQRLNNLGLCQMIMGRYNNAFQYFSQAFHIYTEEPDLNIFGVIKNICQIYKQLQMYQEAVKYYEFIFTELDSNSHYQNQGYQFTYLILSALECVNYCVNYCQENSYGAFYQRAKQFLPKIQKAKHKNYALGANIRLQMLKYGINFGIKQKAISLNQVQKLFHEIMHFQSQDSKLLYLKGECCYFYSELFKFKNWQSYRKLMKRAQQFFDCACQKATDNQRQ